MLRSLLRDIEAERLALNLIPRQSLRCSETRTHAVSNSVWGRGSHVNYATAAQEQKKQRQKVVILGTGWAAASLAKHVNTSKFAVTVSTLLQSNSWARPTEFFQNCYLRVCV